MHSPHRSVRREPALTGQPSPRRVRRPGDPLDDRGTDTAANPAGDILAFHLLIIPATGFRPAQRSGRSWPAAAAYSLALWAVGYYPARAGALPGIEDQTLIEHWNGSAWCRVVSPDPGGGTRENQLLAVTVASQSNAWAVGYYTAASNVNKTLTLHWNGHSWKQVASPDPAAPGMGNELDDVAATSASDTWAAGYYVNASHVARSMVLYWNGTAWRVMPSPDRSTNTQLTGVVAASRTNVWVTGFYDTSAFVSQTLISHWNGRAWAITASSDRGGMSSANYLVNMAVPSLSAALAVGSSFNSTSALTFSARRDGARWKTVTTPDPAGTRNADNVLTDIAATSPASAWAVGEYRLIYGSYQTLILQWTGTEWKRVASPDTSVLHNVLSAVAATSSSNAWAAGYLASPLTGLNLRTLILHWNGKTWIRAPSP